MLIKESVVLTYTYVDPDRFVAALGDVRRFAHRLGRETRQGEVIIEIANRLNKIGNYDRS